MKAENIDRVFGRGRLRMVTGDHVEVFREASRPGERRRYTKRFLATTSGDFRQWTEREWRILARLVGHRIAPVPDVVHYDRGDDGRPALVQTYDAGITVDHWGTLLPVERDGVSLRHVFEDCAHWWALARHCLIALDAIHEIQLVHLDLKADNVCIPASPAGFDPHVSSAQLSPRFDQIALIDFAFSLVSGEKLVSALPIARQTDFEYQSPRLLDALDAGRRGNLLPTQHLDWRCDIYSLAAMLRRYLPDPEGPLDCGWTLARHGQARALVRRLLEVHDADRPARRPHADLIVQATRPLDDADLSESLEAAWRLTPGPTSASADAVTPVTRIAQPVAPLVFLAPERASPCGDAAPPAELAVVDLPLDLAAEEAPVDQAPRRGDARSRRPVWLGACAAVAALGLPLTGDTQRASLDTLSARETAIERVAAEPARAAAMVAPPATQTAALPSAPAVAPTASPPLALTQVDPAADTADEDPGQADAVPRVPTPAAAHAAAPAVTANRQRATPATDAAARAPRDSVRAGSRPAPTASDDVARVRSAPKVAAAPRPRPHTLPLGHGFDAKRRLAELMAAAAAPPPPVRPAPAPAPAPLRSPVTAPTPLPRSANEPVLTPGRPVASTAAVDTARTASAFPIVSPPSVVDAPAPPPADTRPADAPRDFSVRADELIALQLPRIAARAERLVTRVLQLAADDDEALRDDEIKAAAGAIRMAPGDPALETGGSPREAQNLHAAAKLAFQQRGRVNEAADLQKRAFGANPSSAEMAGYLAFLRLRQRPAQVESARQLALHALTTYDARFPQGHLNDWTTLAVASALSGRNRDARGAWFVTLALASDPQGQCRAAVNAYAVFGERLRASVEAMLQRVDEAGLSDASPLCEWPPHWMAEGRTR
ncbi:MAG: hypothetical protein ABIX12_02910 [Rubrivivax sp.]